MSRLLLEIDESDKPVMVLAFAGFALALGIIIFCAPNWWKPSEDINWWFSLAMVPGALGIVGTMAYMVLAGLYSIGKHWG